MHEAKPNSINVVMHVDLRSDECIMSDVTLTTVTFTLRDYYMTISIHFSESWECHKTTGGSPTSKSNNLISSAHLILNTISVEHLYLSITMFKRNYLAQSVFILLIIIINFSYYEIVLHHSLFFVFIIIFLHYFSSLPIS